jgi:hypothetical protein
MLWESASRSPFSSFTKLLLGNRTHKTKYKNKATCNNNNNNNNIIIIIMREYNVYDGESVNGSQMDIKRKTCDN